MLYCNPYQFLGESHPETLTVMNQLGIIYDYQKKFIEAEQTFEKCLILRTKQLGNTNIETLNTMNRLVLVDVLL